MPAAYKARLVHLIYVLLSIWQIKPMQQPAGISRLMSFRRFWMLAVKAVSKDGLLRVRDFRVLIRGLSSLGSIL